jgi:hypothetical protein
MQYYGRTPAVILGILLILIAKSSLAQYPGMGAVRASMNAQFMNQQMNMMMTSMGLRGINYLYNEKYTFNVVLKDGSRKEVKSKIYADTVLHKHYLLLIDKKFSKSDTAHRNQKIYADQTSNISRTTLSDDTIKGMANDSCWMFKVISGPITAYSCLSEPDGQYFDDSSIVGIQLNGGQIVKYNEVNLKQMVGDDINALENIQRKNYFKAIKKYNRDVKKEAKKQPPVSGG